MAAKLVPNTDGGFNLEVNGGIVETGNALASHDFWTNLAEIASEAVISIEKENS